MKLRLQSVLAVALAAASFSAADVIKTKDGTVLIGKVAKINAGTITFETSFAGELSIKQSEVVSLATSDPKAVRLVSGTRIDGTVATDDKGTVSVTGNDGKVVTEVSKINQAWPINARDPLAGFWAYEATLNIQGAEGNTHALDTGASFSAILTTPTDLLKFYTAYDRAISNGTISSNQFKAGVDYSNQFTPDSQWFIRDEGGFDHVMDESFYDIAAAGYGFNFVKTPTDTLLGRVGVGYRYTEYGDPMTPVVSSGAGDFEIVHDYKGPHFEISNDLTYTPTFNDFSNYFITQDSFIQVPLKDIVLKFRAGISNNYNSKPTVGFKRLDTLYYLRLVYDFGAK
jgi:putative salt-induced outer membrane protein YdiY